MSMAKKKEKKKEKPYRIHKIYKIENGKLVRNTRSCPKCGSGVFMAKHINRYHCGKCGYTEFIDMKIAEEVKS